MFCFCMYNVFVERATLGPYKSITLTNKFLHENKDIFVTKADKGNITVLMKHSDYIIEMGK